MPSFPVAEFQGLPVPLREPTNPASHAFPPPGRGFATNTINDKLLSPNREIDTHSDDLAESCSGQQRVRRRNGAFGWHSPCQTAASRASPPLRKYQYEDAEGEEGVGECDNAKAK
jgi:hypothetical protein